MNSIEYDKERIMNALNQMRNARESLLNTRRELDNKLNCKSAMNNITGLLNQLMDIEKQVCLIYVNVAKEV